MANNWLDDLDPSRREIAQDMISKMQSWGAPDAEAWVKSEMEEDIPQMVRFLVLRSLWRDIDAWRDNGDAWISRRVSEAEENPAGYFADAGAAIKRMLAVGITPEELGSVARFVAYEAVFGTLNRFDESFDEEIEDGPGWVVAEVGANGSATGRVVAALHEDLLTLDPSGCEGRVA